MTREEAEGEGAPHPYRDDELAWIREHLTQLRQSVSGQRIVLQSLGIGFVLGLAAHIGGYMVKVSATTEPLKLVGDLLYALGWALWTGVVVALFVEIIPRAKQRQISKVPGSLFTVVAGSHQGIPIQQRMLVQERNCRLVFINHVVGIVTSNQFADKTQAVFRALFVGTNVKWLGTGHPFSPHARLAVSKRPSRPFSSCWSLYRPGLAGRR